MRNHNSYIILLWLMICFLSTSNSWAQKYDNIWCMGYESNPDTTDFGGQNIDFRYDPPKVSYVNREANFDTTSGSMCDEEGNLLFYTNGCAVYGANNEILENGDSLTLLDNYWTSEFLCPRGHTYPQGVVILPNPYDSSEYFLIHQETGEDDEGYPFVAELYYSVIKHKEDGLIVSQKRVLLLEELQTAGSISAVRHADGKRWWIVLPVLTANHYQFFLLDETGIHHTHHQEIGVMLNYPRIGFPARFSQNGKYYARFHLLTGVEIYDFDRSSGRFSNPMHLPFWESIGDKLGDGLEFSPDSKKLYVNHNLALYQFDLSASDVLGSLQLIEEFEVDSSGFLPPVFYQMQLAPNDKIYMSCLNGTKVLHVIHNPNALGGECDFEQRGFPLRTFNALTMPYFPNYDLKADTTVSTIEIITQERLMIYPNPSNEMLYLSGMDLYEGKQYHIYDIQGVLTQSGILSANMISIPNIQAGIYVLRIEGVSTRFIKS